MTFDAEFDSPPTDNIMPQQGSRQSHWTPASSSYDQAFAQFGDFDPLPTTVRPDELHPAPRHWAPDDSSMTQRKRSASTELDEDQARYSKHPSLTLAELEDMLLSSIGLENVSTALYGTENNGESVEEPRVSVEPQRAEDKDLPPDLELELIHLYFETLYVLCPVVKKSEFLKWHSNRNRSTDQSLQSIILKAIIFAAFAHADDSQLRRSGYQSIPEAQNSRFRIAQAAYHNHTSNDVGEVALVQAAIVLTFWSPFDNSKEVNMFWLDEAFRQASRAGMGNSKEGHLKVVWWCCIVRSRFMSWGLRRSDSGIHYSSGSELTEADFTSDGSSTSVSAWERVKETGALFILLSKLSGIMKRIREIHSKSDRRISLTEQEWTTLQMDDLRNIITLDDDISVWRRSFNDKLNTLDDETISRQAKESIHFISIYNYSTTLALYEPFMGIQLFTNSVTNYLRDISIFKIKQASAQIADEVGVLIKEVNPEDLSVHMMAWLILPIAVHLVEMNVHPEVGFQDAMSPNAARLRNLMQFLYVTMHRFDGIKFVSKVIDGTIAAIADTVQRLQKRPISSQPRRGNSKETNRLPENIKPLLLEVVVRTIRSGMTGENPAGKS